jgi:hypothetical protein
MVTGYPGQQALAIIVVGDSIASAHRLELLGASQGQVHTFASGDVAAGMNVTYLVPETTGGARRTAFGYRVLTRIPMIPSNSGEKSLPIGRIGASVTATHRGGVAGEHSVRIDAVSKSDSAAGMHIADFTMVTCPPGPGTTDVVDRQAVFILLGAEPVADPIVIPFEFPAIIGGPQQPVHGGGLGLGHSFQFVAFQTAGR